ncbi:unnamed protein product [Mucor fragilis]
MLRNLSRLVTPIWIPTLLSEDSLCINLYDPIVGPFLSKLPNATYHGNDKELPASKRRKVDQQGPGAIRQKPDRSIEVVDARSDTQTLFQKVKCREAMCKTTTSII